MPVFFTTEEVIHMHDVKVLIDVVFALLAISIVLAALFLRRQRDKLHILKNAALFTTIFYGITLTLIFFNFDRTFYVFHEILFRNNFWLLPEDDMLIKMYPENLFYDYAKFWLIISFGASIIILSLRSKIKSDSL